MQNVFRARRDLCTRRFDSRWCFVWWENVFSGLSTFCYLIMPRNFMIQSWLLTNSCCSRRFRFWQYGRWIEVSNSSFDHFPTLTRKYFNWIPLGSNWWSTADKRRSPSIFALLTAWRLLGSAAGKSIRKVIQIAYGKDFETLKSFIFADSTAATVFLNMEQSGERCKT